MISLGTLRKTLGDLKDSEAVELTLAYHDNVVTKSGLLKKVDGGAHQILLQGGDLFDIFSEADFKVFISIKTTSQGALTARRKSQDRGQPSEAAAEEVVELPKRGRSNPRAATTPTAEPPAQRGHLVDPQAAGFPEQFMFMMSSMQHMMRTHYDQMQEMKEQQKQMEQRREQPHHAAIGNAGFAASLHDAFNKDNRPRVVMMKEPLLTARGTADDYTAIFCVPLYILNGKSGEAYETEAVRFLTDLLSSIDKTMDRKHHGDVSRAWRSAVKATATAIDLYAKEQRSFTTRAEWWSETQRGIALMERAASLKKSFFSGGLQVSALAESQWAKGELDVQLIWEKIFPPKSE